MRRRSHMALIRCPECQREVSDKAYACPSCGHPMREAGWREAGPPRGTSEAGSATACKYRSKTTIFGLPLLHIVYGPAWLASFRPARGFIAIGNVAIGVIAIGGFAVGLITLAGIGLGLICIAGIAIGIAASIGGIATGYLAVGGLAVGVYAIGGLGIGVHTLANDPHLFDWFRRLFPR
jgi:hypothetical protein